MGMAAILFMWHEPFEQHFVPPFQGGSIWKLASIGHVVLEEKMFENVDTTYTYTHIWTTEAYLYYKLTYEPKSSGELKHKLHKVSHQEHRFRMVNSISRRGVKYFYCQQTFTVGLDVILNTEIHLHLVPLE